MIGYDNWRPNQMLVLDLQFRETTGTVTRDWAKPYHDPATLTGTPTWAVLGSDLTYLSFNSGNPDYVVILAADSADLDFTTSSFSGAAWIYPDAYGYRYIFYKGTNSTGWDFDIDTASPYLRFYTQQAGPTSQYTEGAADLQLSAWQFVSFTRSGADARIYLNGRDVTTTPGTHVNPATAVASNFTIGINSAASAGYYDGRMWRPRVWKRALAAWEMLALYEAERDLFGV